MRSALNHNHIQPSNALKSTDRDCDPRDSTWLADTSPMRLYNKGLHSALSIETPNPFSPFFQGSQLTFPETTMAGRGKSLGAGAAKKATSRSSKAGLQFPVGRIARFLKAGKYAERVGAGAPVYLAAVLEYLAAEVCLMFLSEISQAVSLFARMNSCFVAEKTEEGERRIFQSLSRILAFWPRFLVFCHFSVVYCSTIRFSWWCQSVELLNSNNWLTGSGIGWERSERQQENPYCASPYSTGGEKRRRAQQIARVGHYCQRRCDAQHSQSLVAQEI